MLHPGLAPCSNADNSSFDFDSGAGYSTLTYSPCTPLDTLSYEPPRSGFSADANTWLNPFAPIHSTTSDSGRGKAWAEDGDAPWQQSPSFDALENGVDAVSAAFLQLIEAHGCGRNPEVVPLLRLLLCNSSLPREELLDVVDWGRLLSLAATSAWRVLHCEAWMVPSTTSSRHSKLDHSPSSLTSNATTTLSDLDGVNNRAEFLPPADTTPRAAISDYELHGMQPLSTSPFSNGPASPAFPSGALDIVQTASTIPSTPLTISPPIEPEHQQPASPDTTVSKRRCLDCEVEHTKQWRMHPELPGYLCNACGQHQAKHKSPRSQLAIRRERARANEKYAATMPTRPSSPPEKRGGEVIMRVPLKQRGTIDAPT
ncbi:hypothetical protein MVEN_00623000 [Mycena venus]|uniref:GATA-type domain-containing protein n=1 Tax=Mycena venus TaxID=2733690 RepID=A0A8H6YQ04_9AGAR|nr:hypothetical protein MVEN_00623000 [Mycena venus]